MSKSILFPALALLALPAAALASPTGGAAHHPRHAAIHSSRLAPAAKASHPGQPAKMPAGMNMAPAAHRPPR